MRLRQTTSRKTPRKAAARFFIRAARRAAGGGLVCSLAWRRLAQKRALAHALCLFPTRVRVVRAVIACAH